MIKCSKFFLSCDQYLPLALNEDLIITRHDNPIILATKNNVDSAICITEKGLRSDYQIVLNAIMIYRLSFAVILNTTECVYLTLHPQAKLSIRQVTMVSALHKDPEGYQIAFDKKKNNHVTRFKSRYQRDLEKLGYEKRAILAYESETGISFSGSGKEVPVINIEGKWYKYDPIPLEIAP